MKRNAIARVLKSLQNLSNVTWTTPLHQISPAPVWKVCFSRDFSSDLEKTIPNGDPQEEVEPDKTVSDEVVQEEAVPVVSELDSEASKDLREEDDVFHPSSLRSTMTDFIGFQEFVKWTQVRDAVVMLGDSVNLRHTVAAFTTLKGMLPRPPNAYLDSLADQLCDRESSIND